MTRGQLSRLVAQYQRRLGLTHWALEVDFDSELKEGRDAEVAWSWNDDAATVRLAAGEWRGWDEDKARRVVAHELLHLLTRDLLVCGEEMVEALPKKARRLARARWEHEVEGVTERLAALLD